jgi:hypothetical protein
MRSHSRFAAWCAFVLSLALPAAVPAEEPPGEARLDVVFALDISTNALAASGADVNGDGRAAIQRYFLGFIPIRPQRADSLLAAELKAVRTALERLDARTTRVGVVGYSGDAADGGKRGAEVIAPLTQDFEAVRAALEKLARRGPKGMTDLGAGIDLAAAQLGPPAGADAARARRAMILLSDGRPTLPHRGEPVTNRSESVAAAERAGRADVPIFVYGIGAELAEDVLRQIAEASSGGYTRVANPAEIDVVTAPLLGSPGEPAAP